MSATPQQPTIYQHPLAYLIGIEGIALLQAFTGEYDRAFTLARLAEVRDLLAAAEEFGEGACLTAMPTTEGYQGWAAFYDEASNAMIEQEQPVVWEILESLPPGRALDAACGTGRHSAYLASLGHDVIGVDNSPAMLDRARGKVSGGEFLQGDLAALPLPDDHVDLVVCALSLMHVPELKPVFAEFARVLRPRGHLVISDWRGIIGDIKYPLVKTGNDGRPHYVPSWVRATTEYLAPALAVGFRLVRCDEPRAANPLVDASGSSDGEPVPVHRVGGPPDRWALHRWCPEATNAAYRDRRSVLVCQFQLDA